MEQGLQGSSQECRPPLSEPELGPDPTGGAGWVCGAGSLPVTGGAGQSSAPNEEDGAASEGSLCGRH